MPVHVVREGDCLENIASMHGLHWEKVWHHADNRALRDLRKDPNILLPGDEVFVPDPQQRSEPGGTESKHRFRRKGVPAKLRLRLLRPPEDELEEESSDVDPEALEVAYTDVVQTEEASPEPWANVPYLLDLGDRVLEGETDGDGVLEADIPSGARRATLVVAPGTDDEMSFPIRLGGLDPVDTPTGLCDRLNNLGFGPGDREAEMSAPLIEALRDFQLANGLDATGEPDRATKDKLVELHGS